MGGGRLNIQEQGFSDCPDMPFFDPAGPGPRCRPALSVSLSHFPSHSIKPSGFLDSEHAQKNVQLAHLCHASSRVVAH